MVLPEDAWTGETPVSLANAASERRRSGLSPAASSSAPAVSDPAPKMPTSAGQAFAEFAQFVDWSPDGQYLVFSPGLNIIRPDGSGLTSLKVAVGEPEFPDWIETAP